jgi:hypothetical protein
MLKIKRGNIHRIVSEDAYKTKWKGMGFELVDNPGSDFRDDKEKSIDEMTIPELKNYATLNGINIDGMNAKADIYNAVMAWHNG